MNELPSGFKLICKIQPEIDHRGELQEFYPNAEYDNIDNKPLHKDGAGPFCKFRIPSSNKNKTGVYLLLVNDVIKYVGECEDLLSRFNTGYGQISPRNCFVGGQSTNCRINSFIYHSCDSGNEVYLYFLETSNRFFVEHRLIREFRPEWNRQEGKHMQENLKNINVYPKQTKRSVTKSTRDKYLPLKEYLQGSHKPIEVLTFAEIETILESNLPKSAYTYDAWWSNGGHKHADSWMDAGFEVEDFTFGEYVKFARK